MCRGPVSPTLPWAACLAVRAPRRTVMAHRVPSIGPDPGRRAPRAPAGPGGPSDGPVVVRTLLASDLPRPPARDAQVPEGVAFTAVGPFY